MIAGCHLSPSRKFAYPTGLRLLNEVVGLHESYRSSIENRAQTERSLEYLLVCGNKEVLESQFCPYKRGRLRCNRVSVARLGIPIQLRRTCFH